MYNIGDFFRFMFGSWRELANIRLKNEMHERAVVICGKERFGKLLLQEAFSSSITITHAKIQIFLAYIRRCVAALVDRELIKTYIENKIEHV